MSQVTWQMYESSNMANVRVK